MHFIYRKITSVNFFSAVFGSVHIYGRLSGCVRISKAPLLRNSSASFTNSQSFIFGQCNSPSYSKIMTSVTFEGKYKLARSENIEDWATKLGKPHCIGDLTNLKKSQTIVDSFK